MTAKTAIAESCANPAQMVSRFEYAHDANGNRTRQLERRTDPLSQLLGAAEETRYGYDPQDRLVAVAYPDDTAVLYRLDAVGNRTGERRAPASRVAALDPRIPTRGSRPEDPDPRIPTQSSMPRGSTRRGWTRVDDARCSSSGEDARAPGSGARSVNGDEAGASRSGWVMISTEWEAPWGSMS